MLNQNSFIAQAYYAVFTIVNGFAPEDDPFLRVILLSVFLTKLLGFAASAIVILNAFSSWLVLRLAQDFYHWLAHAQLTCLMWLHHWHMEYHHRIYAREYELRVSHQELSKAHWFNEFPESLFMLLYGLLLMLTLWYCHCPHWWTSAYGLLHTFYFHTLRAIRIGLGDIDLWYEVTPEHQTAYTANEDGSPFFKQSPGRWQVNALYHLAHHDFSPSTHLSAAYPWLDIALGTAHSVERKRFSFSYVDSNAELAQGLASALPIQPNRVALNPQR